MQRILLLRLKSCLDADIVCARAKNHYAPKSLQFDETYSEGSKQQQQTLEDFKAHFKPPHSSAAIRMYFVRRRFLSLEVFVIVL